jgi:carboxylate-amine ligase
MEKIQFKSSPKPTLGIELELSLVDAQTMALSSSIQQIVPQVPEAYAGRIKPELMQCFVEINTEVCETVGQAERDLREKLDVLEQITQSLGLRLYWTATHPFSLWEDQQATPDERYALLLNLLQDMGRQLICSGLHVHVGVDSGDKAVMICDRIMRHLPTLLALSGNSPWWNNRVTGLQSHRAKVMESLPTAGLPAQMRNWSEFVWLVNHLKDTGCIGSIRDIWWDVRPHHNFGTVEVRMCDMPGNLEDVLALSAWIQCLVEALSDEIDQGTYQQDYHPMIVRLNKWRAARYGLNARLVDSFTLQPHPVRQIVAGLMDRLRPVADRLDCRAYLERVPALAAGPSWADRQLALLRETGDPREVVRRQTEPQRLPAAV